MKTESQMLSVFLYPYPFFNEISDICNYLVNQILDQ